MSPFAKTFFIALAINMAVVLLGLLDVGFLVLAMVAVFLEMLVALVLLFSKRRRETGLALLAVSGVVLLIAGFMCSTMPMHFQ